MGTINKEVVLSLQEEVESLKMELVEKKQRREEELARIERLKEYIGIAENDVVDVDELKNEVDNAKLKVALMGEYLRDLVDAVNYASSKAPHPEEEYFFVVSVFVDQASYALASYCKKPEEWRLSALKRFLCVFGGISKELADQDGILSIESYNPQNKVICETIEAICFPKLAALRDYLHLLCQKAFQVVCGVIDFDTVGSASTDKYIVPETEREQTIQRQETSEAKNENEDNVIAKGLLRRHRKAETPAKLLRNLSNENEKTEKRKAPVLKKIPEAETSSEKKLTVSKKLRVFTTPAIDGALKMLELKVKKQKNQSKKTKTKADTKSPKQGSLPTIKAAKKERKKPRKKARSASSVATSQPKK